jgi:hypothetical protein
MRCAVTRQSPSDERSAGNLHATFCGSRERVTAPGDPVALSNGRPYRDPPLRKTCASSQQPSKQ